MPQPYLPADFKSIRPVHLHIQQDDIILPSFFHIKQELFRTGISEKFILVVLSLFEELLCNLSQCLNPTRLIIQCRNPDHISLLPFKNIVPHPCDIMEIAVPLFYNQLVQIHIALPFAASPV